MSKFFGQVILPSSEVQVSFPADRSSSLVLGTAVYAGADIHASDPEMTTLQVRHARRLHAPDWLACGVLHGTHSLLARSGRTGSLAIHRCGWAVPRRLG